MNVQKAFAITDAKIQFVSLVDKAANQKQFLITKAKDGQATFSTYGRIIKKDEANHYLTGVVYEPMVEDAHGNYMTEEEITKAAYWFSKNGDSVDIQHSFEALDNATVVENWVAKADFKLGDELITKGTWLMTVEVSSNDVWEAVQKGEITGFSMGGLGKYSEEDVDLENISKAETPQDDNGEKKGVFKKLAAMLGFDVVEKGLMTDTYEKRSKSTLFWNAFYTLEDLLYRYDRMTDKWEFEDDEATVREALTEFTQIVQDILTTEKSVTKALTTDKPIIKAGKKMSGKNKETLKSIYDNLGTFLADFADEKEETDVTKTEVQAYVDDAVAKAVTKAAETEAQPAAAPATEATTTPEATTPESIQKMIEAALEKALTPTEEALTPDAIQTMVTDAVAKAVEPILKSRGVPSNLSDGKPVEKSGEAHYLAGVL